MDRSIFHEFNGSGRPSRAWSRLKIMKNPVFHEFNGSGRPSRAYVPQKHRENVSNFIFPELENLKNQL